MNTEKILVTILLIFVVGGLIYSISGFFTSSTSTITGATTTEIKTNPNSITTGTTSSGDVSIELTAHEVKNKQLVVDISVNTHSVDLSKFDLKQITTLEYNGKLIKPVSVIGLKGHHSSGELIFNVEENIDIFTIKIKGIPKINERIFEWR